MRSKRSYFLVAFIFALNMMLGTTAYSQPKERREFAIQYRFDKIDVDSTYMDNAATIDTIRFCLTH